MSEASPVPGLAAPWGFVAVRCGHERQRVNGYALPCAYPDCKDGVGKSITLLEVTSHGMCITYVRHATERHRGYRYTRTHYTWREEA